MRGSGAPSRAADPAPGAGRGGVPRFLRPSWGRGRGSGDDSGPGPCVLTVLRRTRLTGSGGVAYIGVIDGGAAESGPRVSTFPGFALENMARQGLPGVSSSSLVWRFALVLASSGVGLSAPSLFDNRIGRKRNVDGGVLAACFGGQRVARHGERTFPTVTFPDSSRFGFWARADVFGTRRVRPAFEAGHEL